MTSRGTCLDVSSVLFRPIDGRGTQYVVRCPGTDGAATSGYVDTGISLRTADQLENVVGGFKESSRSDVGIACGVGVACGDENDRGSVKRRQVASAVCGTSKPPVAGGSAVDCSESANVSHSETGITGPEAPPPKRSHIDLPRSSHSLHDANAVPTAPHVSTVLSDVMSAGPWVVPIRGDLDDIARLMAGDLYIGRGSRQRGLLASPFSNPYKVGEYGRVNAIHLFEQYLDNSHDLVKLVPSLSGKRLVCHCSKGQSCHGDILIKKFVEMFPDAYDRNAPEQRPPTSSELNLQAAHRRWFLGGRECPKEGCRLDGCGFPVTSRSRVHFQRQLRWSGSPLSGALASREQAVSVHDSLEEGHGEVCEVR